MKRCVLLFLILLAGKFSGFASHIVGGEFELLHIRDFRYRLNMLLYFDDLNGASGARDPQVTVNIFRKSDNVFMRSVTLFPNSDERIPYSNTDCDDGQLVTSRIFYTSTLTLPEADYSDPEGYYVSWERCCRNYNTANPAVVNIESAVPATGGISAGQTFYLEFPPVTRNGEPFVNSTPRLFPPLRDYGCVDKFYFVDFGGVDDDGDSLVYSMVTPYSTFDTQNAFPVSPSPGPYPEIVWRSGFGENNIMGGNPDLSISPVGLLTVVPRSTGLYVFAVRCQEFRDGVQIGEMRRDFQMLVVENCLNNSPEVRAREKGVTGFYEEGQNIDFQYADDQKCVEILVTDVPISGDSVENVDIRAIPINFNADLEEITISPIQNMPLTSQLDTARFEVCFPDCPYVRNQPYEIGIIALDDACPQPALDTVIVTLNVEPPPNTPAYFANTKFGATQNAIFRQVTESAGGEISFDLHGFDNDNDSLTLEFIPIGFDPDRVGMRFSDPVQAAGEIHTTFSWNYDCNADDVSFDAGREITIGGNLGREYIIQVLVDDVDECLFEDPAVMTITLWIEFPDQTRPSIFESNNPNDDYLLFNYRLREIVRHNIRAVDQDQDEILLSARGVNFDFGERGLVFPIRRGVGNLSEDFVWQLACNLNLAEQDSFRVEFLVEDLDACELTNTDTLTVDFMLSPPPSTEPLITVSSLNNLEIINEDSIGFILGNELRLNIIGAENEGDSLELILLNGSDLPGVEFEEVKGVRRVSSALSWTPDCSVFTDSDYSEEFEFTFVLLDKNCYLPQYDTATVIVHVEDIPQTREFAITNIITPKTSPNMNDYFGYYPVTEPDEEDRLIYLPIDNCAGQFEEVIIHNRWGKTVFFSTDRDFKWYGEDVSAGVYFYTIMYSNTKFQGSLTVMY